MKHYLLPALFLGFVLSHTSCDTDDDNINIPTDNTYHVQFVVNGDTLRFEDGKDGYGNGPGKTANEDSLGWNIKEFTLFIRHPDTPNFLNNSLQIDVVNRFVISPSYDERYALFAPGTRAFGSWPADTTQTLSNGVIITYTDDNGKVWSSDLLFGSQPTSSNFEFTEHFSVDAPLFGSKSRGTFNAILRDGLGGQIQLTNGEFLARTLNKQ